MSRARRVWLVAGCVGAAALLGAGDAAAGAAGLLDMGAVVAIAALLLARIGVRGGERDVVREKKEVTDGGFPGFGKLASDLEWAMLSRRHYELSTRPVLARLADALRRPLPAGADEAWTSGAEDRAGLDPAELERIIAGLEHLEEQ